MEHVFTIICGSVLALLLVALFLGFVYFSFMAFIAPLFRNYERDPIPRGRKNRV